MKMADVLKTAKVVNLSNSKGGNSVKSFSIVNSNNGKRVAFSLSLLEELSSPKTLEFATDTKNRKLYVAENLGGNFKSQEIKYGGKGIIYNSTLVEEITKAFELDFSNKTSVSFRDIDVDEDEDTGEKVIIVNF